MLKSILHVALLLFSLTAGAQQKRIPYALPRKMSAGINLNHFGRDFGIGLNVSSPAFLGGHMTIRASGNYQWLAHPNIKGNETWSGYTYYRLGAAGINMAIADGILLYGEGGVSATLLDKTMSAEPVTIGGYGLFGFEFLMPGNISYYIELGGAGSGAAADKLPSSPIVANGFLASGGMRIRL